VEAADGSRGTLGELPAVEQSLRVRTGDTLVLTRDMSPAPVRDTGPHRIGCSLPEAFDDARAGQPVWIDDGKIHGRIRSVTPDEIELEVLQAGPGGTRLRAEKGINLPETDLGIAALTAEDRAHLPFVAEHADIVSMSFVRSREDVADLLRELEAIGDHALDVTLKIETVGGFEALPLMLLEAMRWEDVGVMIARGDLAVEAGFERLAEVQEEILWLCEAGHVPVVWATQVLESLAKKGLPSRAEVTDAAMGQRAECVMLNKGPFVVAAIEALDDILVRMQGHAEKKSDMLRRLRAWAPLVD
jgi:pyruvate kinase